MNNMRPHPFLVLALVGALLGFVFAGVSTYDFEQHLDRQVHSVHCSFVPGLTGTEEGGSDCEVTLMSQYSSVMRTTVWGGVPISLPAMSVFAFLIFFGIDLLLAGRQRDRRSTAFYALAAGLPAMTSVVMAYISLQELDAARKLCIGIYFSSALTLTGAIGLWVSARNTPSSGRNVVDLSDPDEDPAWASGGDADDSLEPIVARASWNRNQSGEASYAFLAGAFGVGLAFVLVPFFMYLVSAPDHSKFIGSCGALATEPEAELLVTLSRGGDVRALEVFDPLCPACRAFESHLEKTQFNDRLARQAVLFPLDAECNWMLSDSVHPGACGISEAVLCAGDRADEVIDWAFSEQEKIIEASRANPDAARDMVSSRFPELASCVGSPKAKSLLNRSLRWTVDNGIQVLTPQLYVDGVRLCDEDVDLGLEFALARMIEHHEMGTLHALVENKPEPARTRPEPLAQPPETDSKPKARPKKQPRKAAPAPAPADDPADDPADEPAEPAEEAAPEQDAVEPAAPGDDTPLPPGSNVPDPTSEAAMPGLPGDSAGEPARDEETGNEEAP